MSQFVQIDAASLWTRREFLGTNIGLALGFLFSGDCLLEVRAVRADEKGLTANAWVHIATDGTVTIQCPTSEMGQGIMTSLPLILAEELDADWAKVRVVQAPASQSYINPIHFKTQGVGGSRSMRGYWLPMRLAGAQARRVLLANAAARWGVPMAELSTGPNKVLHSASGRSMGYGEIAAFATVPSDLPAVTEAELTKKAQWRLLGKDVPRVDVPLKVNGKAVFGMDVVLPDMLVATVLRPPWATCPHPQFTPDIGIKPKRIDDKEAMAVEGVVKVVPLDHGVAVVATDYWSATLGKRALKVEWERGAPVERYDSDAVLEEYVAILHDPARKGEARLGTGDIEAAFKSAATVVSAEYTAEHVYHAQMEPFNATAWVRGDEVDLWSPTQGQLWAREVAAKAAGTAPEKVRVHTTFVGGGFGLRTEQLVNAQAATLAKVMGKPVKVIWSREDDIKNSAYRPAVAQRVEAALSADGRIIGWRHRVVGDSLTRRGRRMSWDGAKGFDFVVTLGAWTIYDIPNTHHEYLHENRGLPVGYWMANGMGYTKFAGETLLDEIAEKLGKDPLALRLELLAKQPRAQRVLETVAEMADWRRKRPGRGLGIAYYDGGEWNTHIAQIAEVSVERKTGQIAVHKIWTAVEAGFPVQPKHVAQQVETGILFALGSALRERITVKGGQVQQSNFYDYLPARQIDVPELEIKVLEGPEQPSGPSESGATLVAASIANAVRAACGARMRQLPMLPERVLAALKQAPNA